MTVATPSFPDADDGKAILLDVFSNNGNCDQLSMVFGYVLPANDGGPPVINIYPVDLAASNPPITQSTPFLLGSTTKTFVATAFAVLFGGTLNVSMTGQPIDLFHGAHLNDVFTNISAFSKPSIGVADPSAITFLEVLNYTSGLINYNIPYPSEAYTTDAFIGDLKDADSNQIISKNWNYGSEYQYSDLGYAIIGTLLDPRYYSTLGLSPQYSLGPTIGADLPSVMASTLFNPLGMTQTNFFGSPNIQGQIPPGNTYDGTSISPITVSNSYFPAYDTGGGIVTTGQDFATWLAFSMQLATGAPSWGPANLTLSGFVSWLLKPAEAKASENVYPCFGWFESCDNSGPDTPVGFFKNGMVNGASSYVVFTPANSSDQAGVFVLLNCSFPESYTEKSGYPQAKVADRILARVKAALAAGVLPPAA